MKEIMLLALQGVSYIHSNKEVLFDNINLVIGTNDKVALVGNNGVGKSTLLQLLAGYLQPSSGVVLAAHRPYYLPQLLGQYNHNTIAQSLGIEGKLNALKEIVAGRVTDQNMSVLDDDWAIEERCQRALAHWRLDGVDLSQKMDTLSGGQRTKVLLAGIDVHQPQIVLLDEPSNHLDNDSRDILYEYIRTTRQTLIVTSHDRTLLNLLGTVYELSKNGLTAYGGNYDFYAAQKQVENDALSDELNDKEKALRKAKETARAAIERQHKLDARGKKMQEKAGLPTISMNTFRNNAEKSTARTKNAHTEKVDNISADVGQLREKVPDAARMKMELDNSSLHKGKILITAKDMNFSYGGGLLWNDGLNFQVTSGERIAVKGRNGSGKTTLIKLILGQLQPANGSIERAEFSAIYIDQDYSLINDKLSVYDQAAQYNAGNLHEHEIKIRLSRFLFTKNDWDKPCGTLSGGERMRLILCCLTIRDHAPDMIVLDEPTNNLDMRNAEILAQAIRDYRGTLLVIAHDDYFLREIDLRRTLTVGD